MLECQTPKRRGISIVLSLWWLQDQNFLQWGNMHYHAFFIITPISDCLCHIKSHNKKLTLSKWILTSNNFTSLVSEPHTMYPSKTDKPTKFWASSRQGVRNNNYIVNAQKEITYTDHPYWYRYIHIRVHVCALLCVW